MSKAIDAADVRILSVIQDDGTLSVNDVAERVHMSTNACWRRLKRLEADGIVTKRVALVDPAALGLTVDALVRLRLIDHTPDRVSAFVGVVSRMEEVVEIATMLSDHGLLLRVRTTTLPAHDALLARIAERFPVATVASDLVMRSHYRTTAMPID